MQILEAQSGSNLSLLGEALRLLQGSVRQLNDALLQRFAGVLEEVWGISLSNAKAPELNSA